MTTRTGRRRPGRLVGTLTLAAALAGGVGLTGCAASTSPVGGAVAIHAAADRKPAGNLSGPSLADPDATISLSDYAGKVVVLNTWGQWCGPCRAEVDDLQEVYENSKDRGAVLLGVNVRENGRSAPLDFVRDAGVTYPSIYDPSMQHIITVGNVAFNVTPTTVVLDREHRIAAVFHREIEAGELQKVVDELLAEDR